MGLVAAHVLLACSATTESAERTSPAQHQKTAPPLSWQVMAPGVLARAEAEEKLVMIYVGTTWCHWCHVMDEDTFLDPALRTALDEHVVAIRVDADERPDLAERYRDWAWPATAFLSPDGKALAEFRGYQKAATFLQLIQRYAGDIEAGRPLVRLKKAPLMPNAAEKLGDLAVVRKLLIEQLDDLYDEKHGGWSGPKKYPLLAPLEHLQWQWKVEGSTSARDRRDQTLQGMAHLLDPVFGGMYQYSVGWVWTRPHYEKLAFIQARAIKSWVLVQNPAPAENVVAYLNRFMRHESGAYFANQDADLGSHGDVPFMKGDAYFALDEPTRLKRGIPYIDKNLYASHNGTLIEAMCALFEATGKAIHLDSAMNAARAILDQHRHPESGAFSHAPLASRGDASMRFLADQVNMGLALLALFQATGDDAWLRPALAVGHFMKMNLHDEKEGGLFAHTPGPVTQGALGQRRKPFLENSRAARFFLRLADFTGDKNWITLTDKILKFFARPAYLETENRTVGDYLMALEERASQTVHFSVVGDLSQKNTRALYRASLGIADPRRVVHPARPEKNLPADPSPALYICGENFCSLPITDPGAVAESARPFLPSPGSG
jgi:uncharacterized protein YyaL (SSP411 family)